MEDQIFTNREVAGLVLLVIFVAFVIALPGRRGLLRSLRDALRAFAQPMIVIPMCLYLAAIVGAAALASRVGLWDQRLMKSTVLWVLCSGFALFFGLTSALSEPGYFRQALIRTFSVVLVVEFVATLKSFPLWVEIPAQALAFPFAIAPVLAQRDGNLKPLVKVAGWYLVIFGSAALLWAGFHLLRDWDIIDRGRLLREFLLLLWMTPFAILCVYVLAVLAAYDTTFRMMRVRNDDQSLVRPRLAVLLRANVRLSTLRLLAGIAASRIGRAGSFREAWKEIGGLCAADRRRRHHEREEKRQLVDGAGVHGVDDDGRRLDRREFKETCQTLRWLATCHMGHYRNRKRYRGDLLHLVDCNG